MSRHVTSARLGHQPACVYCSYLLATKKIMVGQPSTHLFNGAQFNRQKSRTVFLFHQESGPSGVERGLLDHDKHLVGV